jgi:hypothetical protein
VDHEKRQPCGKVAEEVSIVWKPPEQNRREARLLREQAHELCTTAHLLRQRARDKVQVVLFAEYLLKRNAERA